MRILGLEESNLKKLLVNTTSTLDIGVEGDFIPILSARHLLPSIMLDPSVGRALSAHNKVQYQQEQTFDKQAEKSNHKEAMSFLKHIEVKCPPRLNFPMSALY